MTYEEMSDALDQLQGLPFPPADYQTHWAGLQDLPLEALRHAVARAAQTCDRFPPPVELRLLADSQPHGGPVPHLPVTDLAEPVAFAVPYVSKPVVVDKLWNYYCEDCSDMGQMSCWCNRAEGSHATQKPWQVVLPCERDECPYPHEYVRACACTSWNPVLQKKREQQARYAEQRTKK